MAIESIALGLETKTHPSLSIADMCMFMAMPKQTPVQLPFPVFFLPKGPTTNKNPLSFMRSAHQCKNDRSCLSIARSFVWPITSQKQCETCTRPRLCARPCSCPRPRGLVIFFFLTTFGGSQHLRSQRKRLCTKYAGWNQRYFQAIPATQCWTRGDHHCNVPMSIFYSPNL